MSTNLMFLALLPGIIIIFYVYKKDKVESEPKSLILKLILLGALSCLPAVVLEILVGAGSPPAGTVTYALYEAFCSAALCEELCKFIMLFLGSWRNKAFDYRFDGIVYGVATAVGFALLENVLYVMQGDLSTALMRGVLAVPLHSFCGVFMGIFYGAMKKYSVQKKPGKVIQCLAGALLVPMLVHGIYDSCCFMENGIATAVLLVFVAFLYIFSIKAINKYEREDWQACFYTDNVVYANSESAGAAQSTGNYTYVSSQQPQQEQPQPQAQQPQQAAAQADDMVSPQDMEKVRQYKALFDQGAISEEEYQYWRNKLLKL